MKACETIIINSNLILIPTNRREDENRSTENDTGAVKSLSTLMGNLELMETSQNHLYGKSISAL